MVTQYFFRSVVAFLILACGLSFLSPTLPRAYSQDPTPAQMLESDNPRVLRSGTWTSQSAGAASGSNYLYSSGSEDDVLALAFTGQAIEVIYVAGPTLGTLAIEVDGTVLRTVITTANKANYQQVSRVDYLDSGSHTLKVYAQAAGVIAVDAFVIHAHPVASSPPEPADDAGTTQSSTCAPLNSIHQVSLTNTGAQATDVSVDPSLSANGRYVAFVSVASLVPGDGDAAYDIYVYDRQTCAVQLISVASDGQKSNNTSDQPVISGDGRYVAFDSYATNLVSGDTNGTWDVFVHDRQTGNTTRVSVASGGTQATGGPSTFPAISNDGRYVTFESDATNLVVGDTNGAYDVFVHDRQTGNTTRVSVATGGTQATGGSSRDSVLSGDGRYVAFDSYATNLVGGDTNGFPDVFVHDRQTGNTTRVSVATGGTQSAGGSSFNPALSGDGRFVALHSYATNLVAGDTNGQPDIFVHDRQTGNTTRVSVVMGGTQSTGGLSIYPALSGDGRYVAFTSSATNLVAGDTNGQPDIFVHDRQTGNTTRVSLRAGGTQANGYSADAALSSDGHYVAFWSDATNLIVGDTNGVSDVFITPVAQPAPDTLALFNPPFQQVNLISTLTDNPPASAYTAFSAYAPVTNGQWVMGDWNRDGLDTPGIYANYVFYYTNKASESQVSDWGSFWVGVNGPAVAGRFSNARNDCIGAVDSAPSGGMTIFALYFTCDFSGVNPAPPLTFQWLSAPLPSSTFSGTYQFMAGDFNNDGLDSIAVRRGQYVAFGDVNPAAGPATFDLAQFIGTPLSGSDTGLFVVGDWNADGTDSFGLFYQTGELFYRNDLTFNSGVYVNQSVGTPFGNAGVQVTTWR